MSAALLLAFLAVFVVGPLVYLGMERLRLGRGGALLVAGVAAGCALLAMRADGVMCLALLWGAWVLAVSLLAQALQLRLPQAPRFARIFGFLAMTPTWFGLAAAQWMAN
jgi:hypothetical protein